jgi:hypothetical protein
MQSLLIFSATVRRWIVIIYVNVYAAFSHTEEAPFTAHSSPLIKHHVWQLAIETNNIKAAIKAFKKYPVCYCDLVFCSIVQPAAWF